MNSLNNHIREERTSNDKDYPSEFTKDGIP